MPTTSCPWRFMSAAVTEESTPPDIATTTRFFWGRPAVIRVPIVLAPQHDKPRAPGHCAAIWLVTHGAGRAFLADRKEIDDAPQPDYSSRPRPHRALQSACCFSVCTAGFLAGQVCGIARRCTSA